MGGFYYYPLSKAQRFGNFLSDVCANGSEIDFQGITSSVSVCQRYSFHRFTHSRLILLMHAPSPNNDQSGAHEKKHLKVL